MKKQELPNALLARINRDADRLAQETGIKKGIWQALDSFIPLARESVKIDWPKSVFMPFGLWPSFLESHYRLPMGSFDPTHPFLRGVAQVFSCIAPWRATQDIVRFDPEVEAELKDMDLAGKLPVDILSRLPAWAVFIDAKVEMDGDAFDGFFVQLDMHPTGGMYLALTFQGPENIQQRVPIALGNFTLAEALAEIDGYGTGEKETVKPTDRGLIQALNMVIYLCAYGLQDREDNAAANIAYPKPKRIKKVWRIMPPAKPKIHVLGSTFGDGLRRDRKGGGKSGGTVRPHIRRPHWHHFWKGYADEKKLIVRWLPPIFVGNYEEEDGI